jgi:hypothetical protein
VIAGFIRYVATCSPAGMRIQSEPLQRSVEATAAILDAEGNLSTPPASLGGASFTELIENGTLKIDVDPKFPQAIGIAGILEFVGKLGSATWEILINDAPFSSPFFTSKTRGVRACLRMSLRKSFSAARRSRQLGPRRRDRSPRRRRRARANAVFR